jgi:hypothetical protein
MHSKMEIGKAVCLDLVRTRIEDLPIVRVSTLVANGYSGVML